MAQGGGQCPAGMSNPTSEQLSESTMGMGQWAEASSMGTQCVRPGDGAWPDSALPLIFTHRCSHLLFCWGRRGGLGLTQWYSGLLLTVLKGPVCCLGMSQSWLPANTLTSFLPLKPCFFLLHA